jgi:hypothetical protein
VRTIPDLYAQYLKFTHNTSLHTIPEWYENVYQKVPEILLFLRGFSSNIEKCVSLSCGIKYLNTLVNCNRMLCMFDRKFDVQLQYTFNVAVHHVLTSCKY